jgi:hypothetical protein
MAITKQYAKRYRGLANPKLGRNAVISNRAISKRAKAHNDRYE